MNGITLWNLIADYVQAEARYQVMLNQDGPGATTTKRAAETAAQQEKAAREAMTGLVLTTYGR